MKQFMLENPILNEVSSTIDALTKYRDRPTEVALAQYMHKNMKLPHNGVEYTHGKFDVSSIKGNRWSSRGVSNNWLIYIGEKGSACVTHDASNGSYNVVTASTDPEEPVSIHKGRFTTITDFNRFIKQYIGKINTYLKGTGPEVEKKVTPVDNSNFTDVVLKKFKPVLAKSIEKAVADIRGMVINQIKNDAFESAERKIKKLTLLINVLEDIQGHTEFLSNTVRNSVLLTASYYYPDLTGNITTSSYGRDVRYSSENNKGPLKVMDDILKGDTQKLMHTLSMFRRQLVV